MNQKIRESFLAVAVLVMGVVVAYDHFHGRVDPSNPDTTTVNGVALGKEYAPMLAAAYAQGWEAAAIAIESGKTVSEAQQSLQASWRESLNTSFRTTVEPGFGVVLPAGTEPTDQAKRKQVADLWRAFARGLRNR